ncbi:hypothetical protein EV421DRAFT_1842422 [Armillaria borealis]|uniref:Glycoside hydrolase family 76 protein n=1 Tax=Armillaria borealis TaxID=47425 RepID=A0AA39J0G6_9AGAR|nr:hypothetical protein EV421DRAFT_1842422 [Armillaria borealis]
MPPVFIWTLFALSSYSVVAQDLKSSTAWRSPNITLSKEDRINIAGAALETAINNLNQSNGQFIDDIYDGVGSLYAQMAEFDGLTNQTKYKDMLKQYFALVESTKPGFLDGLSYGYAAARAYNIYQDPDFLSRAVTSWDSARRYTISDEQAASGTMDTKQFTFPSSCKGATLTGGTYYDTDPNNTNIASTSTGLSALLAEATSSKTYIDAAVESAYFIQSHLLNTSNHVVLGSIEPSPNCAVDGSTLVYDSIGSGLFIEGMVVLADITAYNASTNALLRSTIADVTTDSLWQGVNGVYDNNDGGGHYIVRALASLYERNTTSSDLREYIKEYIGVQYNSVIELARSSNESTIYGLPWTGPPGTSFDDVAQITALTALISAIQLADNPTSSDIPTSSASASLSPQSSTGSRAPFSCANDIVRGTKALWL